MSNEHDLKNGSARLGLLHLPGAPCNLEGFPSLVPLRRVNGVSTYNGRAPTDKCGDFSPSQRLAMTELICRPDRRQAHYIDAHNKGAGSATLDHAVQSDRAFSVEHPADVLVIDCDSAEQSKAIAPITKLLANCGITPVINRSGQPDRNHLLARVPSRELQERAHTIADSYSVERISAIRPPGIPHRKQGQSGIATRLVSPARADDAIKALAPVIDSDFLDLLHNGPRADLASRYLTPDDKGGMKFNRSDATQAFLISAVRIGYGDNFEAVRQMLAAPQNALGERYREDRPEDRRRGGNKWLLRSFNHAVEIVGSEVIPLGHAAAREQVIAARTSLYQRAREFRGVGGATDFATMMVTLGVADRAGKLVFGLGVRELAEHARIEGEGKAAAALKRLERRGWLTRVADSRGSHPSIFRISPQSPPPHPAFQRACTGTIAEAWGACRSVPLSAPPLTSVPEAFAWQGAGLSLFKVWCCLEGMRESELATHLNARCRYSRRQLDRLADLGLAVCDSEGRWTRVVTEYALDAAAVRLGVAGRRARQRQRHIREQEGYAAWLREQAATALSASAKYFERAADDAERFQRRARLRVEPLERNLSELDLHVADPTSRGEVRQTSDQHPVEAVVRVGFRADKKMESPMLGAP